MKEIGIIDRIRKVSSILISQEEPVDSNSAYHKIAENYSLKIDFRPFIQVEPVSISDFRKQRINVLDYTAIIFTSRNAVDNLFNLCKGLRIELPTDMKYFCISEQTSNYLRKYIVVRKRKIFTGLKDPQYLFAMIKKNKNERFLFPCSDIRTSDIPNFLRENDCHFSEAVTHRTMASDLSDLTDVSYDILAFFSPSGIHSLFANFPNFRQNSTRIATLGPTTAQAVRDAGLILDIEAPTIEAPSMSRALELYVKKANLINNK